MGIEFYMAKRGRKTKEFHHSGYGGYHCIRTYLLACFNVSLAKAFYIFEKMRTTQEQEMLKDISPYVSEDAWPLFCSSDCDGEWDNATVKGIVREVKKANGYLHPKAVQKEIESVVSKVAEQDQDMLLLCGFENIPKWKDNALKFLSNLERAAEKGCRVFWN